MLKSISVAGFAAVPYLESSALMSARSGKLTLSSAKPNVLVGPNGSGKSALLRSLALRFLATQLGVSRLDEQYLRGADSEVLWTKTSSWGPESEFLKGLTVVSDNGPAVYYRPNLIPGEESNAVTAMMAGYFDEARQFMKLTDEKSSGQASSALLAQAFEVLETGHVQAPYAPRDWTFDTKPSDLTELRRSWQGGQAYRAEVLKDIAREGQSGKPLVLLDEPEQSLDALAEVSLWKRLEAVDSERVQVLVATHSLYPLMQPKRFNLIEAVPGYIEQVQESLGTPSKKLQGRR